MAYARSGTDSSRYHAVTSMDLRAFPLSIEHTQARRLDGRKSSRNSPAELRPDFGDMNSPPERKVVYTLIDGLAAARSTPHGRCQTALCGMA